MDTQPQITFRHMDTSLSVEQAIRAHLSRIERHHPSITACHVVVEKASAHHRRGNLFRVRIRLEVPGREFAISNGSSTNHTHLDPGAALHDAFDALGRQLDHHQRGRHQPPEGAKPMPKRQVIDTDKQPVALNLGLDKLQDIALRARAFEIEDFPDEPDPGDATEELQDREERLDAGEDPAEAELRELIDDLNDDEAVDLIVLVWVGRGDFDRNDLAEARALARERHVGSSSRYLMGIPTLAEYLAEGAAAVGYDLEAMEPE
jgi:ribosome-associated translation inhibitor RaiA